MARAVASSESIAAEGHVMAETSVHGPPKEPDGADADTRRQRCRKRLAPADASVHLKVGGVGLLLARSHAHGPIESLPTSHDISRM
jgi:hypothetical protein